MQESVQLWRPDPNNHPQCEAYLHLADELFYGGQAGGGKTDLLLGLALTAHRKSLILRRQVTQTIDLYNRLLEICGEVGSWNGQQKIWRGLPGNRTVEIGGCDMEADKEKFKGRPHDLKGYDEIPDFTLSQYLFINGWNRTAIPNQRSRILACGNPPTTTDGEWVIDRWKWWVDESADYFAEPGELLWFITEEENDMDTMVDPHDFTKDHLGQSILSVNGQIYYPRSRSFIPAALSDNRFLTNSNYRSTLQQMPKEIRDAYMRGIFRRGLGEHPLQVIPTAWITAAMERWKNTKKPTGIDLPTDVGVDCARGGSDNTIISKKYDNWFAPLTIHPGSATPDGGSVCTAIQNDVDGSPDIKLDVVGVGASVYDHCKSAQMRVIPISGQAKSIASDRSGKLHFRNLRSEMHWFMREALDPEYGSNLALPPDTTLLRDLASPRWKMQPGGIIQVELKDEIKERIGRSPDRGDAVILANYKVKLGWAQDKEFLDRLRGKL